MPTVPNDPFGPWLPWQATCHTVNCCDASSGHAVTPVAFCDNNGRAAFIARACNAYDDMLAALQIVRMSVGWQQMSDETRKLVIEALAKAEAQS